MVKPCQIQKPVQTGLMDMCTTNTHRMIFVNVSPVCFTHSLVPNRPRLLILTSSIGKILPLSNPGLVMNRRPNCRAMSGSATTIQGSEATQNLKIGPNLASSSCDKTGRPFVIMSGRFPISGKPNGPVWKSTKKLLLVGAVFSNYAAWWCRVQAHTKTGCCNTFSRKCEAMACVVGLQGWNPSD